MDTLPFLLIAVLNGCSSSSKIPMAPLIHTLFLSLTALTQTYVKAATTAVYLPAVHDADALALIIRTPARAATDAYYQELLGTSLSILLSEHTCTHSHPCFFLTAPLRFAAHTKHYTPWDLR
jgi:hypothetical protein